MNAPVRLTVEPKDERDFIVRTIAGIIRQNCFGYDAVTHSCRYRTKTGTACAIGLWMPDTASFEALNFSGSVVSLLDKIEVEKEQATLGLAYTLSVKYRRAAEALQLLHDTAATNLSKDSLLIKLRDARYAIDADRAINAVGSDLRFLITNEHIDEAVKLAASEEVL